MIAKAVNKSVARQSAWMAMYFLLAIGLALVTPDSIMDYSWARNYTEFVAAWNPFVEHIGLWSKIPATQWLAAVLNVLAAFWIFPICFRVDTLTERMKAMRCLQRLKQLSSAIVMFVGIWFVMFSGIIGPTDRHIRSMIASQIGMGTTGAFFIMGQWMIIILLITHFFAFGKVLFEPKKTEE